MLHDRRLAFQPAFQLVFHPGSSNIRNDLAGIFSDHNPQIFTPKFDTVERRTSYSKHLEHSPMTPMTPMTAKLLDGASVARAIKDEVASEVADYSRRDLRPGLAAVIVGNDTASHIYVSNKVKTCEQLGLFSEKIELPENTSTEELLELVHNLNSRDEI